MSPAEATGEPQASETAAAVSPSATADPTAEPIAEETPDKIIVSTVNGEVEIPSEPKRIAATYYVGELAALGYKPAGTVTRLLKEDSPHLATYTAEAEDIGNFPPSMEAIIDLEPDLIIATDFDGIEFADYSKVAPTIIIPWANDDVWAKLRSMAALLQKEAEVEAFIAQYEQKAEAARKEIEGAVADGETVSCIRFFGGSIRVYGARDMCHAVYSGLQLTPPAAIAEAMEQNDQFTSTEDISLEELPRFAGDRIFVMVTDEDGDRAYKEAQKLSLWAGLPAVQNNKVYEVPSDKWFTYDPISVGVTLDDAVCILTSEPAR